MMCTESPSKTETIGGAAGDEFAELGAGEGSATPLDRRI